MKAFLGLLGVCLLSASLSGCGDSSGDLKAGAPEQIDMSKNYSPAAQPNLLKPEDKNKGGMAGGMAPVVK